MHTTLLVTVNKGRARTNVAARTCVYQALLDDPAFGEEDANGNRFGVADWFVIGGRTSGLLPTVQRAQGAFESLGSDSDAAPVDEQLYNELLVAFEGKARGEVAGAPVFEDLDGDPVDKHTYIDKKWLVVVDYHS